MERRTVPGVRPRGCRRCAGATYRDPDEAAWVCINCGSREYEPSPARADVPRWAPPELLRPQPTREGRHRHRRKS